MGTDLPKQFLSIGGKTILETAVLPFGSSDLVDRVIVTAPEDEVERVRDLLVSSEGSSAGLGVPEQEKASGVPGKDLVVLPGGKERQDSVANALFQGEVSDDDLVLIHDGVRPYVTEDIIRRVVEGIEETGAVICGIPSVDSLRHEDVGALERAKVYRVQTPQGFIGALIKEAHRKAKEDGVYETDDGGLVDRLGIKVRIVEGSKENIKITTPADLPDETRKPACGDCSQTETSKPQLKTRIGTGFDVHRIVEGRKMILGGVEIPWDKGLEGHSDADVLVHALMDAMLGAAALPDIGRLFPDTDDEYKGISSILLLERVWKLVSEKGYRLCNADMTLICQQPKLAPYIDEMRMTIARSLGADPDAIGIKATTTEKLGFTGRGEGIAAEAVCLLEGE